MEKYQHLCYLQFPLSHCFRMVTAADGAEAFYTLENNQARTELREDAIRVDRKTHKYYGWGHPHLYVAVLDNSTDFEGKIHRLIEIVAKIVGLPSNLKRRAVKYVLEEHPASTEIPIDYQLFNVEKVYLQRDFAGGDSTTSLLNINNNNNDNYSFIRRRSNVDKTTGKVLDSVYQITTVKRVAEAAAGEEEEGSTIVEQKRIINERVYYDLYQTLDHRCEAFRSCTNSSPSRSIPTYHVSPM